jgi:uncharacterized secreted protein with C-terminal beta-propeller domain
VAQVGGYRTLAGPEQVEARCLMDGALPQLAADTFTVHTNDDPVALNVLANDVFTGYAGPGVITALSFPTAGGTANISSDGHHVLFRPSADFSGTDTFSYVVDNQFTAQVDVQVVSPLANDTATAFPDGRPHTIDVLGNDPFWSGYTGARQITSLSATTLGGTVSIGPDDKSVIYSAPANFAELGQTDHFSYIVDGKYTADVAVSLFDPLAPSQQDVPQNSDPVTIAPAESFDQWPSYAGPQLVTKVVAETPGSSVSISPDGRSILYQPAKDFLGSDTITYVVDGKFSSTISVSVGQVVYPDSYAVDANDPGTLLNVLQNDIYYPSYSPGSSIRIANQITAVTEPDHGGHVSIADNGSQILYTPAANFIGSETFTYQANSRYTTSVTVDVSRPGRDDFFPNGGQTLVADSRSNVLDVLANDFYRAGTHSITSVGTASAGGTVTISPDGQRLLYSPQPGFIGQEQFFYTVDGQYTATVTVNVQSPAADITQQLDPNQEQSYRVDLSPGLRGIVGYTGQGVVTAVSIVSGDAAVTISPDGRGVMITGGNYSPVTVSYTIDGKYTANLFVSFNWSIYLGSSNTVVDQNLASQVDVLANSFEHGPSQYNSNLPPYQGPWLITAVFGAQHGTVSVAPGGKTVIYRSDDDYVGQDTFEYLVDGHELGSASVQVIRHVRDDQYRVNASSQGNVLPVELNDQLGAGYTGIGRITGVGTPVHGTIQISADGHSLVYTPTPGYAGADTVTYTVDGHLKATVTITVAATADSAYPRFASLAALEDWLLQNAIQQYSSLFGTAGFEFGFAAGGMSMQSDIINNGAIANSADYSQTNVQVDGVDEADLTEADSNYLYVLSAGKLVITQAQSVTPLSLVSETPFDGTAVGMYLSGDRLTVVSQVTSMPLISPLTSRFLPTAWGNGQTIVTIFNVTDRSHPSLVQKTVFDGTNVDSRQIGGQVYLVLNQGYSTFSLPPPTIVNQPLSPGTEPSTASSGRYETQDEYVARVRADFGEMLDAILPHFSSFGPDGSLVRSGLIVTPDEIGLPSDPSDASLETVVTIDTASTEPGIVAATGVLSTPDAQVYMNQDSLYLLQNVDNGEGAQTGIWKFTLNEATGTVKPAAYGQVPGTILDQFSVDESNGDLRIATTVSNSEGDNWSGIAENDVWVLDQDGSQLDLIGGLQNLALGESIRSVRFSDDRVVITTFPTAGAGSDPVYCIDLADPTQPRFVGELTLPGFNQYMQFIDDTHVLTVGVNAPSTGSSASLPLQVSLFDVADFTHPQLMDQYTLARFSTSAAQDDHHAFGWFPESGILALPIERSYTQQQDLAGDGDSETTTTVHADEVQYFHIDTSVAGGSDRAVQPVGTIDLTAAVLRSAFIGDTLYAIGDDQIVASQVADPGTPVGSVSWTIPNTPNLPITFAPIIAWPGGGVSGSPGLTIPLTSSPAVGVADVATAVASPGASGLQPTIDTWVQAARSDLAVRLHVSADSALLVSVEAPTPTSGDAAISLGKFVLQSGDHDLLYEVASDGSVQLADADFHFVSDTAVSATVAPSFDVNGDGRVSPADLLLILDNLVQQGSHYVHGTVLRQMSTDGAQGVLDVNHDGMVSPQDLLLEINALRFQQPATVQGAAVPDGVVSQVAVTAPLVSSTAIAVSPLFAASDVTNAMLPATVSLVQAANTTMPAAPAAAAKAIEPNATPSSAWLDRHDAALALTDEWSPAVEFFSIDEAPSA